MKLRSLLVLALVLAALPAAAAESALMLLRSTADPEIELRVADEPAALNLLERPAAAPIWRLEPGTPVKTTARPPARVVELYSGTARAPSLVARVVVRYYAEAAGWVPYFRLDEQPALVNVNGRWQPLVLPGGAGQLVRYGSTLPNPEGFFPRLDFGPPGGTLALVGWKVL